MAINLDGNGVNTTGLINSATAQASTSGTSIDFTGIPSGVKRITVMLNGVSTSGSAKLRFQLGAGSITSSGYAGASVAPTAGQATDGANYTNASGFDVYVYAPTISASALYIGTAVFTLLGSNAWVCAVQIGQSGAAVSGLISGSVTLGGALDRVRITTSNGTDTFDAGSINILYE